MCCVFSIVGCGSMNSLEIFFNMIWRLLLMVFEKPFINSDSVFLKYAGSNSIVVVECAVFKCFFDGNVS